MSGGLAIQSDFVTRFAPSPSGLLHKGHAYSALMAFQVAQRAGARFLLRIEDIDTTRCKPEFTIAIYEDLAWLGIAWEKPVRIQSEHFEDYATALGRLKDMGVVYPASAREKIFRQKLPNPLRRHTGRMAPFTPAPADHFQQMSKEARIAAGEAHAWRLDLKAALAITGNQLTWQDEHKGLVKATPEELGDVVLARKDTPTSYHLSVVHDDALQGITHIVRGEDLWHATHIHVVLQKLLGYPTPTYSHHRLLTDEHGKRFAKRDKALTLRAIRDSGVGADELIKSLRLDPG